jgi:uncharacterized protein
VHLAGLYIYPVKSLRGCPVAEAEVDALGVVGDRRFLVVDPAGKFMTQRTLPKMALIGTALEAQELVLSAAGSGEVRVAREAPGPARTVSIWASDGLTAQDCGDEPAGWLSEVLKTPCRLVRVGNKFERPIPERRIPAPLLDRGAPPHRVSFQDAFPFLLIGQRSLDDLNDRLAAKGEEPVPMNRFRPNLVVEGSAPFDEDSWGRIQIGNIVFHRAGHCVRCAVTTTDQETAVRGHEPLATLATYRRDPSDSTRINFGQNLIHETKSGRLRVGDAVAAG